MMISISKNACFSPHPGALAILGGFLFFVTMTFGITSVAQRLGHANFSSFPQVSPFEILEKGRSWVGTALTIESVVSGIFILGGFVSLCKKTINSPLHSVAETHDASPPFTSPKQIYYHSKEDEVRTLLEVLEIDDTIAYPIGPKRCVLSFSIFIEDMIEEQVEADFTKQEVNRIQQSLNFLIEGIRTHWGNYFFIINIRSKNNTNYNFKNKSILNTAKKFHSIFNNNNYILKINYLSVGTAPTYLTEITEKETFSLDSPPSNAQKLKETLTKFRPISEVKPAFPEAIHSYREITCIPVIVD